VVRYQIILDHTKRHRTGCILFVGRVIVRDLGGISKHDVSVILITAVDVILLVTGLLKSSIMKCVKTDVMLVVFKTLQSMLLTTTILAVPEDGLVDSVLEGSSVIGVI
jgi:hypothetical protein